MPKSLQIHVRGEDAQLLDQLSKATGRRQTNLVALAVSWFVRQPSLAPAGEELEAFARHARAQGFTEADWAALRTLTTPPAPETCGACSRHPATTYVAIDDQVRQRLGVPTWLMKVCDDCARLEPSEWS